MSNDDNRFSGIELGDDLNVVPVVVSPEPIRQIELEDPVASAPEPVRNFIIPRLPEAPVLAPVAPVALPVNAGQVRETLAVSTDADGAQCGAIVIISGFLCTTVDTLTERLDSLPGLGFPRTASLVEALGEAMKGTKVPMADGHVLKGYHREGERGAWSLLRYRDAKDETPVSAGELASLRVREGRIETTGGDSELFAVSSTVASIVAEATEIAGTVTASAMRQWVQRTLFVTCEGVRMRRNDCIAWIPPSKVATVEALKLALSGLVDVDLLATFRKADVDAMVTSGLAEEADTLIGEIRTLIQGVAVGENITERKARGVNARVDALCERLTAYGRLFPTATAGIKALRDAVKEMDKHVSYGRAGGLEV